MLLRRWAGREFGRGIYLEEPGDRSCLAASPRLDFGSELRTTSKKQDVAVYPKPQLKASVNHSGNPN